ncbi:flagellar biosynthesis regulator FlaF [Rhodoplanes azumiensis]|uniref:Flagellar biosynthesis regulator FlaF n=1 Tax=Rhodoplanes azumiensis TaxID=1897628 RepID=A0ABW5AQ79_9BRAD
MPCIETANSPEHPTPAPREIQALLLRDAAWRLQAAQSGAVQNGEQTSRDAIDAALVHNRRLWHEVVEAAAAPDPALPCAVRHSLASLGLLVDHQTVAFATDPRPERLATLIGINRDIADGLLGA